jgi:hypothetical protein
MPVKYKPSNFVKSTKAQQRSKTTHYYMHQLDNTQLWKEFFSTSNKKFKRKMRNELYMRGYRLEDFTQRQAER